MTPRRSRVSGWVRTLRRPQVVIQALKAFMAEHDIHSFADLEQALQQEGVEVHSWELDPTIDGAAVVADGTRYILLRPYLHHLRRACTLFHELGHHKLHLNGPQPSGVRLDTGGITDVEADCFVIVCLGLTVGEQNVALMAQYMRANPDMLRRSFLVIVYFAGYTPRLWLAALLDTLFLSPRMQGGTSAWL